MDTLSTTASNDALAKAKAWFKPLHKSQLRWDQISEDNSQLAQVLVQSVLQITNRFQLSTEPCMPAGLGVTDAAAPELLNVSSLNIGSTHELEAFLQEFGDIIDRAVKVHAPRFIGHMTSALPNYVPAVMYLLAGLNQNQVKLETSGGLSVLEKQVLHFVHRQIFKFDPEFYESMALNYQQALGVFCSGGTIGNLTALWALRNQYRRRHPQVKLQQLRLYVSALGHYSIRKSLDVLGFESEQLRVLPPHYFLGETQRLHDVITVDKAAGACPLVIIGVAGSTETGSVDNLNELAAIAHQHQCYFHVDAAWGGAFAVAGTAAPVFQGIEKADSVVIDAHKQLYVPMGCGLLLTRSPDLLENVRFHANYVIREGSFDLGQFTLEGSRSAMSVVLFTHFRVLGLAGYRVLFDYLLSLTRQFAQLIQAAPDFELTSAVALNILTYRFRPTQLHVHPELQLSANPAVQCARNVNQQALLNQMTVLIQKKQRSHGQSFVSRTRLTLPGAQTIDVFRVVLANPLTQIQDCQAVLADQMAIARSEPDIQELVTEFHATTGSGSDQ